MRHCSAESVDLYEATGEDLADLLHMAGTQLDKLDGDYSHATINVSNGIDETYCVTLYVH